MHALEGVRPPAVIRSAALGFAASAGFALVAVGAFYAAAALLQPDRWPDPGLGWVAVVVVSSAAVFGATLILARALRARERAAYLRANRRR